jgi:ParB family chromosome partitioning protein
MAKKIGGLGKGLDAIFIDNEAEDSNATVTLRISEIEPNHNQPRHEFDEKALAELAESIREHGLIQPILVRPLISGGYQIVAGERRYRASRMAGLTEVPVTIRELTDEETMELALIENLQRENLNPLEEAMGYKSLMDEYSMSQEQVSKAVGKSRSAVANTLRLLNLPPEVSSLVRDGKISSGHGRALLSFDDEERMLKVAQSIISDDLSVRQVESLAKKKEKSDSDKGSTPTVKKASYFSMVEQTLTEYLGKKVTIAPLKGKKGGVLQIEFYSNEELKDLANKLEDK